MPELVFVGTGDAFGSGGRRNTAILVREAGRTLLLDCGPTTCSGLKTMGIDPRDIDAIAITHFHADHVAGVPFLLLDYLFETRRDAPLEIHGPPGIRQHVERLASTFHYVNELDGMFPLHWGEHEPGKTVDLEGFRLTPLHAHHTPATHPHMLRVEAGGRSLMFSGDTGWHDGLPDAVGDVDLFVSECVFMTPGSYSMHLSVEELAAHRTRFRCGAMRLTHLGSEVIENLDRVPFDTADDGLVLDF